MNVYFIQGFRKFNFADYSRSNLEHIHNNFNLTIIDIYNLIGKKGRNKYIITNLSAEKNLPKNLKILEFKSFYSFLFFLISIEKKSLVICEGIHSQFLSIVAYIIIKIRKSYIVRHGYMVFGTHISLKKEKFIDKISQILNNRFKLKIIKSFHKEGAILDYGGGDGQFYRFMKKNNWNSNIYDPFFEKKNC